MFDILYIAHTAESGQREPPRLVLEVGWDFKVPSGPTQLSILLSSKLGSSALSLPEMLFRTWGGE